MYLSIPLLFAGILTGLVLSAITSPPTRKMPKVPEPNDPTTYRMETGCVRVQASEVPCTSETDSLNILAAEHK